MWLAAAAAVLRDLVILGGAYAFHRVVGQLDIQPSAISNLNTALLFLLLLATLADRCGLFPLGPWLLVIQMAAMATIIISGVDYAWRWSLKARQRRRQARADAGSSGCPLRGRKQPHGAQRELDNHIRIHRRNSRLASRGVSIARQVGNKNLERHPEDRPQGEAQQQPPQEAVHDTSWLRLFIRRVERRHPSARPSCPTPAPAARPRRAARRSGFATTARCTGPTTTRPGRGSRRQHPLPDAHPVAVCCQCPCGRLQSIAPCSSAA